VGDATVTIGVGVCRIELDGAGQIGYGAVVVTLIAIGQPAMGKSGGAFRVELDGAGQIGDGAVVVTLITIGLPAMGKSAGVFRVELLRSSARRIGDAKVILALLVIRCASV
jgi:hypothetical protein